MPWPHGKSVSAKILKYIHPQKEHQKDPPGSFCDPRMVSFEAMVWISIMVGKHDAFLSPQSSLI